MAKNNAAPGFQTFTAIWLGQIFSTIGSELTWFGMGVWILEKTGSTTLFSLNLAAFVIPAILVAPFAGVLTDRWDRRWVMILSDTGAAFGTLVLWGLASTENLQVWQVYPLVMVITAFTTLQWPAFSAATTMLVPREHLGRAGGMVQIGRAVAELIAPALAGAIFITSGLGNIILIDILTFLGMLVILLVVRIPKPPVTEVGQAARGSFRTDLVYGWKYVVARRGLLALLIYFAAINFVAGMFNPVLIPLMLDLASPDAVGLALSVFGIGLLAGTVFMSIWGGPPRRVLGVIVPAGAAGLFMMLFSSPYLVIIAIAGACYLFLIPIVSGSSQALWQSKVPPDVQGRVFAVRSVVADSTMPLAILIAGPLSERVFEPLLDNGGSLVPTLGYVFGIGPHRGAGLMFVLLGLGVVVLSILAFLYKRLLYVEDEIPDYGLGEELADQT